MKKKKVLIFYSKTAGGHLRTAEAVAEQLRKNKDLDIHLLDALEKTNFGIKVDPARSYGILLGPLLPVFNLLYVLTNNAVGILVLRRLIKAVWGTQFKNLIEYIEPDLIITTHHFISPTTIRSLKKNYPFVTIVTDLGLPHRIWFDKKADRIITPTPQLTKLAKLLLRSRDDQIIHLGYPLKNTFKPNLASNFFNTILIMGGGGGTGNIEKQLKILQKNLPDKKLVVLCGFNKKLYDKLCRIKNTNTTLYQFVDNVDQLMAKADIIITKAGPGTIIEAAQMKKPMIVTSWVGLQEKENVKFIINNNLGLYCSNLNKLTDCILHIYQNYPKFINSQNWSGLANISTYLKALL